MKILFVEDNPTFSEGLVRLLRANQNIANVTLALSKSSALTALSGGFYDLLILDLNIPVNDGELEVEVQNGHDVFFRAIEICPGIPIFILTGSEISAFGKRVVRYGENIDLWGSTIATNTLDYLDKEQLDILLPQVFQMAEQVRELNQIALNFRGMDLQLSEGHLRCLKVVTRRVGAVAAEVVKLTGGRSRARVVRVDMRNGAGVSIQLAAAKLHTGEAIKNEDAAFAKYAQRLPSGVFPHKIDMIDKGACGHGGIFYRLAEDFRRSLFQVLRDSDHDAAAAVIALREGMKPWIDAAAMKTTTIAEMRSRVLWDASFEKVKNEFGLDLDDVERMSVSFMSGCIHGDLHGSNVLVNNRSHPILIDFGDIGEGASCFDPVMLELSAIFHPDSVDLNIASNLHGSLALWPDRQAYSQGHPYPEFHAACREWAYDSSGGDFAVLVATYCQILRQLRFQSVDPHLILIALHSILERIRKHHK
jgi:CheY-like chemotaxis protein